MAAKRLGDLHPATGTGAAGAVVAVLLTVALAAAQSSPKPLFRSQTDLVALDVTILDANGNAVRDLPREAFSVDEDDRPRPIEHFLAEPAPLSLVIALDASGSMQGQRFEFARRAVSTFFKGQRLGDEIAVIGFNDRVFSIAPWSRSADIVDAAIGRVVPTGTTALYDAISASLDALGASGNRRQAVVVISDGNDFRMSDLGSKQPGSFTPSQLRAIPVIERIQHNESRVYAIGIDAPAPVDGPDQRFDAKALRALTDPSGGVTRIVRSDQAVVEAAQWIADELSEQYQIGFQPAKADGKVHRVRVTIKNCAKCRARTRTAFVAPK
jgi:Ca-activated chloride channel homolog